MYFSAGACSQPVVEEGPAGGGRGIRHLSVCKGKKAEDGEFAKFFCRGNSSKPGSDMAA